MRSYVTILIVVVLGVTTAHSHGHGKCSANLTVSVDECCKIPQLVDVAVIDKCRKQFPFKREEGKSPAEHIGKGHHVASCMASCILTAVGTFKNKRLDIAAFKAVVQKAVATGSPFTADSIGKMVDECAESSQIDPGFLRDIGVKDQNLPDCSIVPKVFVNCVYASMFQNCPAAAWNVRKECVTLKDRLNDGCPYFALRKHPRHET